MAAVMEAWETTGENTIYVRKTDPRGREIHDKVGGRVGARLLITTEDRELNQLSTADPEWDVFTNGMLVPVKVADPDLKTGNALSKDELVQLLTKTGNAFSTGVAKIDSETTLRRLKEVAVELDARPSQMSVIDKALEPYQPRPFSSYANKPDDSKD